ncbi:hypothetical protein Pmani_012495 [Petrolisthes manimaculis]|uniref:Outer dynein arm-docking complex subunit 4 n=1 Tax=Petrolisthes manimaculis TaxID=1843537 RepID=A0AAE1PX96_9EUCA|nr:hypothetical protein Pmani_012495 [Petrolisthes manimaculis]
MDEENKEGQSEEARGLEPATVEPPSWMAGVVVGGRAEGEAVVVSPYPNSLFSLSSLTRNGGGVAGLGTLDKGVGRGRGRGRGKGRGGRVRSTEDGEEGGGGRGTKGKMVSRFMVTELRQKRKLMGHLGAPGREEIYCDKDRAAAVAMGDQDIKTSLKVKMKKERRHVQPEDTNSSAHLTEAQRAITQGKIETALSCAQKAVESGGGPASLVVRGRCHLLLGHFQEAMEDAREALNRDASLVKAVLVQAEALYGMGEFERSLVLFHRGARKRPDLVTFTRGIHKAREAIINAIGGDQFPELEELVPALSLRDGSAGSGQPQVTSVPTITLSNPKNSKSATKRLLGGLSRDKEFLASLVGRQSLRRQLQTTEGGEAPTSGALVESVAKEALTSLQHLESFMWQRDPGGGGTGGGPVGQGGKTVLQKEREKKEKARMKATLRRRVAIILDQLQQEEDVEGRLLEAEELLGEVRAAGVGGRVLCRLLLGVGMALPKCNRHEDAVAVLTDAVHLARASEYNEEEHVAVEALGRTLAVRGQHSEAVAVWERRIPAANSSRQRASLFLLIAKSYFAMRKVETGRFYGTKSVKEADDGNDNNTALSALLALVEADARQDNSEAALKTLEKCSPHLPSASPDLVQEYNVLKNQLGT